LVCIKDQEGDSALCQVVADGETRLASADHNSLNSFRFVLFHGLPHLEIKADHVYRASGEVPILKGGADE